MATVGQVDLVFTTRGDGIIEVAVEPNYRLLNHALSDAVSSRAPKGAAGPALSTYWIERAQEGLRSALESGDAEPFASGNVTYFRLDGEQVVAGYEFDAEENDAESLPAEDFLRILEEWKLVVVEAGGVSGAAAMRARSGDLPRPMGPAS